MTSLQDWMSIINTFGVVGLLVLNLWMFATGRIMPKATVDTMMKAADERTTKVANEIKDGIKEAVQQGIIVGINEVRKIGES